MLHCFHAVLFMHPTVPSEILEAFTVNLHSPATKRKDNLTVEKIDNGLINHSFKVRTENNGEIFLQQINSAVFKNPEDVQHNYLLLWKYTSSGNKGLRMPVPVFINNEKSLLKDSGNNYWRAFEFIPDSKTHFVAREHSQANTTASVFATFTAAFSHINTGLLKEVIPCFHNLSFRYEQFEEALKTYLIDRLDKARHAADELQIRKRYKNFYDSILASSNFPLRVMHHDAKISNILFHSRNGNVICPVDYDTVMPGYFFSDIGDMIRSMVCPVDENCKDLEKIIIRKEFYDAIIEGYLEIMTGQLTEAEKKNIHYAGIIMIYMQALRFLSDYLNGDIYYHTTYDDQNLDRALNQLTLLKKLELFLSKHYPINNV
jgi:thiamine kinase-like enzyme